MKHMKDLKLGDDSYKAKGLKKLVGWVKASVARRYLKAAKERGQSKVEFISRWLSKKAPR